MNKVPMTVAGEAALREELERLKKVDRPRISAAIADAREHGDLKENAEYHAAREQQSFTEGRIMEIEGKLGSMTKSVEENFDWGDETHSEEDLLNSRAGPRETDRNKRVFISTFGVIAHQKHGNGA